VVIMNLVSNAALRAPKRFPLELTVERLDVQLKVDGDRLGFHVFKCRRDAVAVARVEDRWVYVNAPASLLRRLDVVPKDVGSSGPPWRLSAVQGSSVPRRTPDGASR
jgi:hypothetical protein